MPCSEPAFKFSVSAREGIANLPTFSRKRARDSNININSNRNERQIHAILNPAAVFPLTGWRNENRHREPLPKQLNVEIYAGHVPHHAWHQEDALERLTILRQSCVLLRFTERRRAHVWGQVVNGEYDGISGNASRGSQSPWAASQNSLCTCTTEQACPPPPALCRPPRLLEAGAVPLLECITPIQS